MFESCKVRRAKLMAGLTCAIGLAAVILILGGCERKERILDVQTPGADVKVDRNIDTGRVDVDVNRK